MKNSTGYVSMIYKTVHCDITEYFMWPLTCLSFIKTCWINKLICLYLEWERQFVDCMIYGGILMLTNIRCIWGVYLSVMKITNLLIVRWIGCIRLLLENRLSYKVPVKFVIRYFWINCQDTRRVQTANYNNIDITSPF